MDFTPSGYNKQKLELIGYNKSNEFIQKGFDDLKFTVKPLMSVDELSKYLDLSSAYIHKMTHNREIPYYKPNGKKTLLQQGGNRSMGFRQPCGTSL